jgi:hypothetical protein
LRMASISTESRSCSASPVLAAPALSSCSLRPRSALSMALDPAAGNAEERAPGICAGFPLYGVWRKFTAVSPMSRNDSSRSALLREVALCSGNKQTRSFSSAGSSKLVLPTPGRTDTEQARSAAL